MVNIARWNDPFRPILEKWNYYLLRVIYCIFNGLKYLTTAASTMNPPTNRLGIYIFLIYSYPPWVLSNRLNLFWVEIPYSALILYYSFHSHLPFLNGFTTSFGIANLQPPNEFLLAINYRIRRHSTHNSRPARQQPNIYILLLLRTTAKSPQVLPTSKYSR